MVPCKTTGEVKYGKKKKVAHKPLMIGQVYQWYSYHIVASSVICLIYTEQVNGNMEYFLICKETKQCNDMIYMSVLH